jgi:hypothetical protein
MTKNEFITQMNRLIMTYGEKSYPDERFNAIWEWAKNINEKLFKLTITEVISNHAQAPMKSKIVEAYSFVRTKNPEIKKHVDCVYCAGSGFIPDEKPVPKVYRCRCSIGDSMPSYIARWEGYLTKIVPTEAELNWRNVTSVISTTINQKKMQE